MHDIFLSYASEDLDRIRPVIEALKQHGWDVWWDRTNILPGQTPHGVIDAALHNTRCILVVWSTQSVNKPWVIAEATEGLQLQRLIPVRIDEVLLPLPFRPIHTADLTGWQGDTSDPEYLKVVQAVTERIGAPSRQSPEPDEESGSEISDEGISDEGEQPHRAPQSVLLEERWTNRIGMEFVSIQPGEFLMGSEHGNDDEKPVHRVRISQPFYLGVTPVTQAQWETVMEEPNPSPFKGDPQRPVESVSWNDVQDFIRKLHAGEPSITYRLPSEAEWEYAARAGSTGAYGFGDHAARLREYAWYSGNSGGTTHPVAERKPNKWGLCDMHGNVWEWVQDWYASYPAVPADATAAVVDPTGPDSGLYRVVRGGGWFNDAGNCRSALRGHSAPGEAMHRRGFRLLRQV